MKKIFKKISKKKIFIIATVVVLLIVSVLILKPLEKSEPKSISEEELGEVLTDIYQDLFKDRDPVLNDNSNKIMFLDYFKEGSTELKRPDFIKEEINSDNMLGYYSFKKEKLPKPISKEDFIKADKDKSENLKEKYYPEVWQEVYDEYGEYGTRFLNFEDGSSWGSVGIKEIDIDMDGEKEKIISMRGLWGYIIDTYKIIIVKNDEIIFSIYADRRSLSSLEEVKENNGFYLEWLTANQRCHSSCISPQGYTKTRFIYKDTRFIPIYEEEIEFTYE